MPGGELSGAKRAYRSAKAEGNHQEEARWANVIGDILKNRGEYVQALKWLRIDYDVSMKFLSQKQVLPTCQSLGEVYLRLQCFKDALIYQKKHLELARDACDIVEEQRASTQLGRTYHEMFLRSEDDHYSIRNAKKYFKNAMRLAQDLKEKSQCNKSSFLKEYVDAHNNIGMLEMDLDNLEEAQKILTRGLEICNEEEVIEDDDGRSRLHHNLGNVYMELRKWDKAQEHIEKDIIICKRIKHCQGEAKGYVNLGELHYRVQKYDEAILCYQKALDVAKSMEDEDALVSQIHQNIETVKEAMKVMDELKMEEQNLKKLTRNIAALRGTPGERKCLLQKNACIDHLIDKSSTVFAWKKHLEFAKRKKIIASELCDKEKLGDAYLALGDSYQKLRIFNKALKWYSKSWDMYKAIGNKEGQALVKINIGDVLDSDGDWVGALEAFEEGYRIAVQENLSSVQISAIENMHYSHMIRFDNVEEARRLQLLIDKLKQSNNVELKKQTLQNDCCSETDTEGGDNVSCSRSNASISLGMSETSSKSQFLVNIDKGKDDVPLISPIQSSRTLSKLKADHVENINIAPKSSETSPKCLSKSTNTHQMAVARKRARVVSDDEDEKHEVEQPKEKLQKGPTKVVARSDECVNSDSPACHYKNVNASNFAASSCTPDNLEESSCSHKCQSSMVPGQNGEDFRILSTCKAAIASKFDASSCKCDVDAISKLASSDNVNAQIITLKIDNEILQVEADSFTGADLSIESIKTEVACLYYLQLPKEKRSKGLLPIIRHMECGGRALESIEEAKSLKEHAGRFFVEVLIDGWVQRRLMKLYVDSCNDLSEAPNMKLLKKLYNLEVSEDEVIVSGCDLQDISVVPLLNAMHAYKTVAALDLSHNLLGNGTLEKLQRVLATSGQKYGSLILDLHCNQFGPTALFQVCECPVLLTRLEVLNISGNRLTDACGCYLSTILENCKALYSLNIERCSITSRTIQKIADSLNGGCALSQLAIGYNNPISRNAFASLLAKLSALERFSELNLNGLKLSKMAVGSICLLAKACSLSGLMLGGTSIGTDNALLLNESLFDGTQELAKLDLSYCGLTSRYITEVNAKFDLMGGLSELNLGGNPIMQEGSALLALLLKNAQCCLKVLVLDKCQLALTGIIQIIQALADNESLEELNVAGNTDMEKCHTLPEPDLIAEGAIETLASNLNPPESSAEVESVYEKDRIRKLSAAIGMAKQLKFLDLSDNGLTAQVAESLYALWSTSRTCLTTKHIKEQTVHLSVQGIRCCKVKPCCRRD